ncbi:CPBP family intramembrane glutamic endopeptidase [Micromonospora costi]|uniref:CPBP family intramembrane glutamic endopeptidase n=1 Tax=Micromonospora costi TaxID=1530042 RepID=UPI0033CD19FD
MIALFYAVTMVGAGLIGMVQPLLGVDPEIIELVQFGPALGALAVLPVWRRRWRPPVAAGPALSRPVLVRLLAVAALTAGIFGTVVAAYALVGADVRYTRPGALAHSFWIIAAAQFVGACAEESGWRCFLQPYLRTRFGVVSSGTIVGLLWGLWHVQVFAAGPVYAAAFLLSTIAISVIMAVLLDGARGHHLLVAGAFHTALNLGLLVLLADENGDPAAETIFAAACVLAAVAALVTVPLATRRRTRRQRFGRG